MRIIAGSRGGRRLKPPPGRSIRPTPDRVREALFSILADRVPGARFLDLFAGTGANGLEALSRGALSAHFIDASRLAVELIRENTRGLDFQDRSTITTGTLPAVLARLQGRDLAFDIVFADPPYESALASSLLASPYLPELLAPRGMVVLEAGRRAPLPDSPWNTVSTRDYGDTRLFFLDQPSSQGSL